MNWNSELMAKNELFKWVVNKIEKKRMTHKIKRITGTGNEREMSESEGLDWMDSVID